MIYNQYPSPYFVIQIRDPFYGAQKVYVLLSTYSAHTYPQIRESPMCASTVPTTVVHTIACEIVQISAEDHGSSSDQSFTSKILCFLSKL